MTHLTRKHIGALLITGVTIIIAIGAMTPRTTPVAAPPPAAPVTIIQVPAPAAVAPATVAAPAPAAAPVVAAPATSAILPTDVVGQNAEALRNELTALGYKHFAWNSDTGKTVLWLDNWTVTSLEQAGQTVPFSKTIVIHVTKPGQ